MPLSVPHISTDAWASACEEFSQAHTSMLDGASTFPPSCCTSDNKIRLLPLLRCMSYTPAGVW